MQTETGNEPLTFGRVVLAPSERLVSIDGRAVPVGARAFDVLLALAQRRERLVSRQELLDLVWPGLVVEEHNITTQISTLRKLLGPHMIATVPGRGYRFVAAVESAASERDLAGTAAQRSQLPETRTRFIGRAAALADLERLLGQTRLLTLTGTGGCGKTRLALECAQRLQTDFADGVWFVDLAPLSTPERVPFAFASTLGLGDDLEGSLVDRLAAHVADRRALFVLDNCEHVLDAAASLVDALLARPGQARILATSREPLHVQGEQLYPVHTLSLPATDRPDDVAAAEAVRLFVDRARLAWPEFGVDDGNASTIAQICRRLDGLALAIELAAANLPLLSVSDVAARLDDRFRLLTRGNSPVARQRTLAATIQWSYDQLDPHEQQMFRLLAVFCGGWTLEAAAAVAQSADEYAALEALGALYDKSLLVVDHDADLRAGPRYRMLETVRQYARERLDASGETEVVLTRHAAHFLALAESADPYMGGPQESAWLERLHAEHENLAAAMSWCADERAHVDPSWAVRLAAASNQYWLFNEVELGCRLAVAALKRDGANADSKPRFRTLRAVARMYMHRGHGEAGLPYAREALDLARRVGDVEGQAAALNALGTCLTRVGGDDAAGRRHYEQARDLAQASGSAYTLAAALNNIAGHDYRLGDIAAAEAGFSQAVRLARGLGDVRLALIALHNLVRVLVDANRPEDARAYAVEAELLLRDVSEDVLKLELLEVGACLASIRGEHDVAARFWGASCQRYVDAGYSRPVEDEEQLERLSKASRLALGESAYKSAESAGKALQLDAAMREVAAWLGVARE